MNGLYSKQLLLYDIIKPQGKKDLSDIETKHKLNPELKKINNVIAKRSPVSHYTFGKKFDYVIDGLNLERGFINNFKRVSKIVEERKNNLRRAKILIVVRAVMKKQSKRDNIECKKLVSRFRNIHIIYIHTNVNVNQKNIKLIETCRTNHYCTPQEAASGVSIRGERLCTTPIVEFLDVRPKHVLCEIDDLLTYYFALKYNAKVISNTEDYSKIIDIEKIKSLKLFLNVPISYYKYVPKANKVVIKNLYINPLKLIKPYLKMYENKKLTPDRSIVMRGRIII